MKQRLDNILVQRGFFNSRSQAAAAILGGQVSVNGQKVVKAGASFPADAVIEVEEAPRFVSRGGLKLEKAFDSFPLDVAGKAALDGGASTGGFTDCLLKHEARKVIAVDVGYGQLDWKLRKDPRVEVLERTNLRYIKPEDISERPAFAALDVSFISLKKVIPPVIECLQPGFELVALVKPQFEAGRNQVGKGGVVRDIEAHRQVLGQFWDFASEAGCEVRGLVDSGVRGPKGNIEYLFFLSDARHRGRLVDGIDRVKTIEDVLTRVKELLNPA